MLISDSSSGVYPAVQLYVVSGDNTLFDYLVCAKSAEAAVDYVAKNVLMKHSAKLATPMQVAMLKDNGQAVLGEDDDLVALGIGD